jgi:hypothetical protein
METVVSTSQLYKACHVLFGSEVDLSVDFLRYLQIPGLKAVYRKKALETHPDRAIALDRPPVDLEEQFKEVNAAYQELHQYLENPRRFKLIEDSSPKARPRSKAPTRKASPAAEGFRRQFFKGAVPKRELLFGQYVYYYGRISYRQLIDAIIWQKIQRPLIGNLAVRSRLLDEEEVRQILRDRRWGEKFGETALRGGYLTPEEIRTILKRQKFLQPRIGKYFVEKKILPATFVERMAEELRRHNRLYRSR